MSKKTTRILQSKANYTSLCAKMRSFQLFSRFIVCFLCVLPCASAFSAEENFILINGTTNEKVLELGPHLSKRVTPCSTFKIALGLIGFDSGILKDETTPTWAFQEGYDDFLEAWKSPQTPHSWIQYSCVWYSNILVAQLGWEKLQSYLTLLEYGNQDISGGLENVWINSSLKVSPEDQVTFIQKMLLGELPVSGHAIQMTKALLFREELFEGWKLFGKTGWGGSIREQDSENLEIGWFVGWLEKDDTFFPFAYSVRAKKIDLAQRIPRTKQLLREYLLFGDQSITA